MKTKRCAGYIEVDCVNTFSNGKTTREIYQLSKFNGEAMIRTDSEKWVWCDASDCIPIGYSINDLPELLIVKNN